MKSPLLGSSWSILFSSIFILCLHSSLSSPAPNLTIALDVLELKRCSCPSSGIKGMGPNLYCHYLLVCPPPPTSPQLLMSRAIINLPWKHWLLALHSAPSGLPLCSVHKHSWTPLCSSSASPSYLQQWQLPLHHLPKGPLETEVRRVNHRDPLEHACPLRISFTWIRQELDSQTEPWEPQWDTAGRKVPFIRLACLPFQGRSSQEVDKSDVRSGSLKTVTASETSKWRLSVSWQR